jgi:hypothetical protein
VNEGSFNWDMEDEITAGTLVVNNVTGTAN